jgi:transcriptional regulator with PAS, ATPase and Fis domain
MIGAAQKMIDVYEKIGLMSSVDAPVLIRGESGTGKELVARAIHNFSARSQSQFVAVNCGALPETLLESELFGHERGAFTGANGPKPGLFEVADDGTIFLDEIGTLTQTLQVKLLRVLQDGEYRRLGGTQAKRSRARVIAATDDPLEELIQKKQFRSALFYRLNVLSITLPPLRERAEDIPALIEQFVNQYAAKFGKAPPRTPETVLAKAIAFPWPGNVRQLENAMQRAVLLCRGETLAAKDVFGEDELIGSEQGATDEEEWWPTGLDKERVGKAWRLLDDCENLARQNGSVTHQALADAKGCTRANITQTLNSMKSEMHALLAHAVHRGRWLAARPSIARWKRFS